MPLVGRPPLSTFRFHELTEEFVRVAGEHGSALNVTKFLCGISSPRLVKLNAKKISCFGALERYPFPEVQGWVGLSLKLRRGKRPMGFEPTTSTLGR